MKHIQTFESFLNESSDWYHIVDSDGNFLTRKSLSADYSFTDNMEFASSFDDVKSAESVIKQLKNMPQYKDIKLDVVNRKNIK
jgi:hypothetical protein